MFEEFLTPGNWHANKHWFATLVNFINLLCISLSTFTLETKWHVTSSLYPGHSEARFRSSATELITNACFSLERLSRSFRLARPGISPLERLWNGFDSDAELFMYRT